VSGITSGGSHYRTFLQVFGSNFKPASRFVENARII